MIFLTVGTSFPFDRLVKAVDGAVAGGFVDEQVFAQIGTGGYRPKHMEYVEILEKNAFDSCLRNASEIISHAGIGTMTMTLEYGKPMLVMPRRKCYKELVNEHQLETAKKFEQLGHVLVAYSEEELPQKISYLNTFVPKKRESQPELVAQRIAQFLNELNADMN